MYNQKHNNTFPKVSAVQTLLKFQIKVSSKTHEKLLAINIYKSQKQVTSSQGTIAQGKYSHCKR